MLQKRFLFSCCLVLICTLLALLAFLPSTASAATVARTSTRQVITHVAGNSGSSARSHSKPNAVIPFTSIHRVPDDQCASRSDFFKLWNGTTIADGVCFASDGTISVEIDGVYAITSGNNAGYVIDRDGDIFILCQWAELDHYIAHVVFVAITGRTC